MNSTPNSSTINKQVRVYLGAGMVGVALLAFILGRGTAPQGAPSAKLAEEHAELAEHEDEHTEGDTHGEEGHGDGEEKHGHDEEAITFEGDALKQAGVQVAPVTVAPQFAGLPFNGTIEASPNHIVRVSSVVPGRVSRLMVNIGERVRQGQILAVIESRAVGEAQSAYQQATARLQNARTNLNVVEQQAQAGVFSRVPLEAARQRLVDAQAEVRAGENAVRSARSALENVTRLARAGSFASPAIEAARRERATAQAAAETAKAGLTQSLAAADSARAEVQRRSQIAAGGGYISRPVQESQRVLTAAQSARATAESEVNTTRANLDRARTLSSEGLVSKRDLENAQTAYDTAQARLQSARSEVESAQSELARQQQLAATNATGNAEVQAAQSQLATAEAGVRTHRAELERAQESLKLAERVLTRESAVFSGNIANRRELVAAQTALESARNGLTKARSSLTLTQANYAREARVFRANLNTKSQLQAARAQFVSAQAEVRSAQTALQLFRTSPGGSASIPIVAPMSGVVQERAIALGEVVSEDTQLMTIADTSIVHVDMFIPERDIPKVRLGAPIIIRIDAAPGRTFPGSIELIHTELNPKTRTVETHAELANPTGLLRFGMFARGTIQTGKGSPGIHVPSDAIQDLGGRKVVFVQGEKPGTFEAREVKTGLASGGRTLITEGLRPGENIVVKGAFMVKAQAMKAELGHEH